MRVKNPAAVALGALGGRIDMNIKLTKEDAEEVLHKLGILANTPDLQESYGISQEHADRLLASVPRGGGIWDVSSEWALKTVRGEMLNHVLVLRDIAQDARNSDEKGQALRICKQAARLERIFK